MQQTAAKAITAALVPLVLALLAKLATNAGIDIPVEPSAVEAIVGSVVSALLVYLVPNKPKA